MKGRKHSGKGIKGMVPVTFNATAVTVESVIIPVLLSDTTTRLVTVPGLRSSR